VGVVSGGAELVVVRLSGRQVLVKELELVAGEVSDVLRPEASEMVDRVARELTLRRTSAGFFDRWERDHSVLLTQLDEHRSLDVSNAPDGAKSDEGDEQPGGR
jgi:hypothetical protein